ncbi:L-seryl-tRNA(Sec) selenium transferase [Muricomes intestini]|uniref:L-seryl-tRNA(Sec) selenium transferase n=2 Tax=Muricomes intestini TaxID=1796634 RepID=A0A4R3K765_9FIRM|nr:L-seryl-tRNA(Sec) selenium transferase [Muricomes intestini]TCS78563.1 L-seryl-tRNA(Sec) selenium transferase [Muricomes intestini]HAX52317.1 L-seryl-tRNA(Sec) selenium transferase [Lachnospiraceae bacterium]HCR83353.1 L-seryl-tRNA(Sec) selenium transferase [Lachnospiraceae bacterium]
MDKNLLFRRIPKVDILMEEECIKKLVEEYGYDSVLEAVRIEQDKLRAYIGTCENEEEGQSRIDGLLERIELTVLAMNRPNMTRVLNGTGTILHTNLGRAPLGSEHLQRVIYIAGGYSNLEYDLEAGKRGERYSHFEKLLCRITGAEAAMAVNNNAAAVLLILSSLAKGGEAVVSRGELVEVGGKFRIPDVMEQSGASLVEVGATNKTHLSDYEKAITEASKALLKVHTSNYRIVGFTESVPVAELVPLGRQHGIPVIEDLGSGVLVDLSKYGLTYEPTVQDSVKNGADVVCFSGDKLLGGPQAGIIVGKKIYIDLMKKNPLTRALRIDKFTASALEAVLREYLSEEKAIQNIPVLNMITRTPEEIKQKAKKFHRMLKRAGLKAEIGIEECESQIGGGSLPLERIPSTGVTIHPLEISTPELEERLRHFPVPVIGRTVNDRILLDMRTFETRYMTYFAKVLKELNVLEKEGNGYEAHYYRDSGPY